MSIYHINKEALEKEKRNFQKNYDPSKMEAIQNFIAQSLQLKKFQEEFVSFKEEDEKININQPRYDPFLLYKISSDGGLIEYLDFMYLKFQKDKKSFFSYENKTFYYNFYYYKKLYQVTLKDAPFYKEEIPLLKNLNTSDIKLYILLKSLDDEFVPVSHIGEALSFDRTTIYRARIRLKEVYNIYKNLREKNKPFDMFLPVKEIIRILIANFQTPSSLFAYIYYLLFETTENIFENKKRTKKALKLLISNPYINHQIREELENFVTIKENKSSSRWRDALKNHSPSSSLTSPLLSPSGRPKKPKPYFRKFPTHISSTLKELNLP